MHAVQAQLANGFRLSFDHFGRSSSLENHKLTQHFAGQLEAAGLIKEVIETQIYSHVDRRYLQTVISREPALRVDLKMLEAINVTVARSS